MFVKKQFELEDGKKVDVYYVAVDTPMGKKEFKLKLNDNERIDIDYLISLQKK